MWGSQTGHFGQDEMTRLWSTPALMLAEEVAGSPPVVALRCLAEVMLNNDIEKLTVLLVDPKVTAAWQAWQTDSGLDERDLWYASQMSYYLARLSNRRVGSVEAKLPDLPVVHAQLDDLNYPNNMDADDTSLWVSQYFEPGTRIILRCDQVNRPYFPTASYYESGTVTGCGSNVNGRYCIDFRHDPWPSRIYLASDEYTAIKYKGITEFETRHHTALKNGAPVVLLYDLSHAPFYVWGEVIACQEVEQNFTCYIRVVPGQV